MNTFYSRVLALGCAALCLSGSALLAAKPAILFCARGAVGNGDVDLDYLKELKDQGFEVDYTTSFDELTWDRIKQYNVLILYQAPQRGVAAPPATLTLGQFDSLMEQFLNHGGGILAMIPESHGSAQQIFSPTLMRQWDFLLPTDYMQETNPVNVAMLSHMVMVSLAYTSQVRPSPVSAGVTGIWYPYGRFYFGQSTNPLLLNPTNTAWQVVVQASRTTVIEPIDFTGHADPPTDPLPVHMPKGMPGPAIFAIRSYGAGRLALMSAQPQYSIGSGTKWFFNREVLSAGLKINGATVPSDYGLLLKNTFTWLAAGSLGQGQLGGYVTDPNKLLPPNYQPAAVNGYPETAWTGTNWNGLDQPATNQTMLRGLIGAKTTRSSGTSTVAEYAAKAKALGLQFVVFADDYAALMPAEYASLKSECAAYDADPAVRMIPGYAIESNVGNRYFMFGRTMPLPDATVLTGTNNTLLKVQDTAGSPPLVTWSLLNALQSNGNNNIGIYDFTRAEAQGGLRMSDCRLYGLAAVRYYRAGVLVENKTDEYLTTAQGCIPPAPVSFNEVNSAAELEAAVANQALTYVRVAGATVAAALPHLLAQGEGLYYSEGYTTPNVFPSDAPLIQAWTPSGNWRVATYASQEYVTGRLLMPSLIDVTSAGTTPLKEITIYDGQKLYRRFAASGTNFHRLLILDAATQKNLVLVAEDVAGHKAVSNARLCRKEFVETSVGYCGDRVNNCPTPMLMAKGPYAQVVTAVHPVPNAGSTWDGGPPATFATVMFGWHDAELTATVNGTARNENSNTFNTTSVLDYADEGAGSYTMVKDRIFDTSKVPYLQPWQAYGPSTPTQLMEATYRLRLWLNPTIGPPDVWLATAGIRPGVWPTLVTGTIQFKQALTVNRLVVMQNTIPAYAYSGTTALHLVYAPTGTAKPQVVDLTALTAPINPVIEPGGWFGFYSPNTLLNSHLYINRGSALRINVANPRTNALLGLQANITGAYAANSTYRYELLALSYPLDTAATNSAELVNMQTYLNAPTGLTIQQGTKATAAASPGLLDLTVNRKSKQAAFTIRKPTGRPQMTLPARVNGLNPNWTAGLWLKEGYMKYYPTNAVNIGTNRYTPLGMDNAGEATFPVAVTWAPTTRIQVGHPVTAGDTNLIIQVTHVNENPPRWHVSVNNPTTHSMATTVTRRMTLPGLNFKNWKGTVPAGGYIEVFHN